MKGLGSAQDGGQRLKGDPDDIVVRLLVGEGAASRLRMKPQHTGLIPFCLESLFHNFCPESSSRPEFCDLFNESIMQQKKKVSLEAKESTSRPARMAAST